jgi:dihydroorotase
MVDLCLKNCKLSPRFEECSIGIDEGRIASISRLEVQADEYIDLCGKIVLPGLIDAHVHLRDPGMTYKEDFHTGTAAAAAGGFTTVLDMPNTFPATDTAKAFLEKLKIGHNKSLVDFGLHAGVSDLREIRDLSKLSPSSFKIFMDLCDHTFLMEAFRQIGEVDEGAIISLHPEDQNITQQCTQEMKKLKPDPEIYARARPPLAEEVAVGEAISLSQHFQQKVHLCHISTPISLEMIKEAKNMGTPLTAEITPHHLFLDSTYLQRYGNLAKTNPPLRDPGHKLGTGALPFLDILATDHAPHTLDEKEKDVWNAPPGVPGLEIVLSLLLTQVNRGLITLEDLKRLMCENPSHIFNLKNKGYLMEGMDADLVVLDLKKEGKIDPEKFLSKAHYTPFKGFEVKGMPIMTMVRGKIVMEKGEVYNNKGHFCKSSLTKS